MFLLSASGAALAQSDCTPFQVHRSADLPAAFISSGSALSENELVTRISAVKTQEEFSKYYRLWASSHSLTEIERKNWLECLYHYVSQDTDKDGIPDWSALSDRQPARTLYPQDEDQDGDGIPNVLDALPLTKSPPSKDLIPPHLRISETQRPEAALFQEKLYKDFGILAIDHTDLHSAAVLREFYFLMQKGFSGNFVTSLKNIKYLYAFSGHMPARNTAAYHVGVAAISVGGINSYPENKLSSEQKISLLLALSHEVGHALLFAKLSAKDLAEASRKFLFSDPAPEPATSLYSPFFFQRLRTDEHLVSQYAATNRHEWFAESVAAAVINDMGASGHLGIHWKKYLVKKNTFNWYDYTKIGRNFRDWFHRLVN